ncbi:hypothetical protein VTK73DRAFT_5829 [Phialemonium thermophilum]|uniref:Uncharacterized protein n=1 Tax=Phialemonium thermophilum TaxID=223376 RepID=A0ABR3V102_9PEZI
MATYEARGDHGDKGFGAAAGAAAGHDGPLPPRIRGRRPVTDYGATIVHWMRHRQPRYKGSYKGELERPSPSYIVDVSRTRPHTHTHRERE